VTAFLITVGAAGALVILGLAIALLRQLKAIGTSLAALNRELEPLVERIREDAGRATDRMDGLAEQARRIQEERGRVGRALRG
jgi:hypothetical protein